MSLSAPKREPSRARRLIIRAAVYLTLGLVSCVLVTWWMALVRPWSELTPNVFGRTTYLGMRNFWGAIALHEYSDLGVETATTPVRDIVYVGVGVLRHETVEAMREGAKPQSDEDFEQKFRGKLQRAAAERSILARALPDVPIVRTPDGRLRVVQATYWGWPMRCLSAVWIVRVTDSTGFNRKTVLGGWLAFENSFGYPRFILPYSPVWPGLIVNTLLYAAAIGAIVESMMFVVRSRRRRAGRCAACGYTLKGLAQDSPCPECGLESAKTKATPNEGAAG